MTHLIEDEEALGEDIGLAEDFKLMIYTAKMTRERREGNDPTVPPTGGRASAAASTATVSLLKWTKLPKLTLPSFGDTKKMADMLGVL